MLNSPKLMAEITWIFFYSQGEGSQRLLCAKDHGWMVYVGRWIPDEPKFLRAIPLLQGPFRDCLLEVVRLNRRRNIWRHTSTRPHPRREFLLELQKKVSSHTGAIYLFGEARPYFSRTKAFDLDPMILQLLDAVVDLRRNYVRKRRASEYTSKAPPISVPNS